MQRSWPTVKGICVNLRKIIYFAIILWLTGQLLGCAWFQAKKEKTARELAEEGMEAFKNEDYKKAIASFEKLKDWYPFSQYAMLAELKLGDAHYHRKEYDEAIFAYEEFENLHPKNEAIPYVIYQTGRCYFERLQTIDRDQTMTREALQTFERLIRTYPASPYAKKARDHLKVCNRNLAEHEFYVGLFYYKSKHYKAALERFKTVVKSYPDLGVHHKALQYISLCHAKIDNAASGKN
ncbi:MAG: outer membrane protein assembly factor BamD [Deltaproteobacteria bacterium]|nr:MAG: outer membrane protein assembly factor BamD [Deltaproteobacteria bacterium]